MKDETIVNVKSLIFGLCFGMLCMLMAVVIVDPYKRGQIDALTGNIKYSLVEHKDGTKSWERTKPN